MPSKEHARRSGPVRRPAGTREAQDDTAITRLAWNLHFALTAILLVVLVVATYAPTFRGGLLMDDEINLASNRTLYTVGGLWHMWFDPNSVQQYYPLVHTMFWVERRLWGFEPAGYHVVNVLLHAASVVLLWRLLLVLRLPGAWLAAALFAVHPVEVESVAWIIERKNVLSMALALASLLCHLRFEPVSLPGIGDAASRAVRWRWYGLALLLFTAAMFAKTVVLTLPAVLLVIYWWKRGRLALSDVAPLLPLVAIGVGLSLVTVLQERNLGAHGPDWTLTWMQRVLVAGRALWFYAGKLVWPFPLSFYYARWTPDVRAAWQYLFPAAAVGAIAALWLARQRLGRGPLAAVLIFAGVMVPALGFFKIYFQLFSYVANHFQYHASAALLALAAASAATAFARHAGRAPAGRARSAVARSAPAPNWPPAAKLSAAAVLAGLAIVSFRTARVFHDQGTLTRDAISKNPEAWIAYSDLGLYLCAENRFDEAIREARHALELAPNRPRVAYNYGKILLDRGERIGFQPGDLDTIVSYFEQAAKISPEWASPHVGLGVAMFRAQRNDEALVSLNRALELQPDDMYALCTLGSLRTQQQQFAAAQQAYHRALAVRPDFAEAHCGLGVALSVSGQLRQAADEFTEAVRLRPAYAEAWNNLGITRAELREFDQAVACLREALHLIPDSQQVKANLAKVLASQRQGSQN